jgi:hypothetical protein
MLNVSEGLTHARSTFAAIREIWGNVLTSNWWDAG